MTPDDLRGLLSRSAIVCRVQRDEVLVETCRFCGNTRWNLELNANLGVFHCWACDAGGRLDGLLAAWLGERFSIPVNLTSVKSARPALTAPLSFTSVPAFDVPSAAVYLERRGVTKDLARVYELEVCTQEGHQLYGRVVLPVRDFWSGVAIGYVGRSYTNKKPKYISTLRFRHVVLGYRVRSWQTACVLVEGNFDGIIVHRAGFHAVILGGVTAPWVNEFAARLSPRTPLVVLLDGTAVKEAERLQWALRAVRPSSFINMVRLPEELDPASIQPHVLSQVIMQVLS